MKHKKTSCGGFIQDGVDVCVAVFEPSPSPTRLYRVKSSLRCVFACPLHGYSGFLTGPQNMHAWVNDVWDSEFTATIPMEDNIEWELASCGEEDFKSLYTCLLVLSKEQLEFSSTDDRSQWIWEQLRESGVSVQSLVAVLSFFVLTAKAKAANAQQRVRSLHAASLYLLLLGIPGSIANKVFHEIFFHTCLRATTQCWPQDIGRKRKKDTLKSSQAEGKRSKPHRKEIQEDPLEGWHPQQERTQAPPSRTTKRMEMDEEEEEEEELHLSSQDLKRIRNALVLLVQSLLRLLQTFTLRDKPQSAYNCTQIFSKLLYFEPVIGEINFAVGQNINKMQSIPEMAFYGMQMICTPKHGDQKESLRRVFHRLLYVILMMNKGDRGRPTLLVPTPAVLAARDQAIQFVCHIVNELKDLALPFLKVLLQHICFQIVEKCEFRYHGAQAVGILTSEMSNTDYAHFIRWLHNFSRHSKMVSRLFSVDVVMVLLGQPERRPEEYDDPSLSCYLPHQFLIQSLLFARRNDPSPTVQSHFFTCLAQCLELPSHNATYAVQNLFSATVTQTVLEGESTEGTSQQHQKTYHSLPFRTVEVCSNDSIFSDAKENITLLLRRIQDSKSNVRKSALQALVGLLKHGVIPMKWENLSMLSERCRDPAVSVKKKALQCVGEILDARPDCNLVQKAWLHGVVPAVVDSENSVQEKSLEALDHFLLSQVKPYSASRHLDASQRLTWKLLNMLCDECQNLSQYFNRAITVWTKQNQLTATFINNLISHTEADHSAGAWLLLSTVVSASPQIPCGKILDFWEDMVSSKKVSVTTCCHIMCVIGEISAHLNEDTKDRIVDDLTCWLKSFTMSLEVISAAIDTLHQLGSSEDIKQTQSFLNHHCGQLVSVCEDYLAGIILNENGTQNINEELMVKYLHTFGLASLNCPARVTQRMILLVESILTTHRGRFPDSQDELTASLPVSKFKANSLPTKVRAHGVITLGKLCLQHEELVQKYLPVFARELKVGTEVAVRNNVVIVMCDLCVRYTNLLDHYISNISACLRDDEAIIREQTLIMLTNLLQEEFVKWKGSLFFRFMVGLVDPEPAIASLCEYCLVHLLLKKNPEMFGQHFIECIYHFNSYSGHNSYNKFPQTGSEKVRFSLKGPQHREKRFRIYRFLLQHFSDAQRFNITNKINQSVLACFAVEELPLDADGTNILSETFNILTLKEMKLQVTSPTLGSAVGEEQEEGNMATMAKAVLQAVQNNMASQVKKKAFIENTVPLIISLKHLLERKKSPVLKDLTNYLKVTMQDYRHEVKDFFAGDEQLAAEVEFTLKEAEKERQMVKQMENCNLNEHHKMLTHQDSVHCSPVRSRLLHPYVFSTPQPQGPNRLPARQTKSEWHLRVLPRTRSKSSSLERTVIPQGGVGNRAISTPNGDIFNVTFEGFSAIYSDKATSSYEETNVLHVRSDEKKPAGPRQWNVQSPLRLKKKTNV
ncbi:condensin-2 complex subunit D3 isoform X2 [Syngnathoides biaculeatus]|uniref:condensin-2 complex subunit D3 isoform X2 n=1 Tax=Syngnathoides biaculeatus TaxID=300417 RepID=UPI002ADE8045|nr:condensin-2 complex subunit D3 isoform X2 [Syngnathoides biaculeatus]